MPRTIGPGNIGLAACAMLMAVPALHAQESLIGATFSLSEKAMAPGDAVRLAFWREPDFNGEYAIDETGFAILPLLGPRNLTALPPSRLKRQLQEDFAAELRNQEVQITLLRRVRILGAVNEPGLYHVDQTMTLADAIALAGGATRDGRLDRIQIYRGGYRLESDYDLRSAIVSQLQSGDQINVPERSWLSRNGIFLIGSLISATAIIVSQAVF
jgi:polysaccharide export outer membrane protein